MNRSIVRRLIHTPHAFEPNIPKVRCAKPAVLVGWCKIERKRPAGPAVDAWALSRARQIAISPANASPSRNFDNHAFVIAAADLLRVVGGAVLQRDLEPALVDGEQPVEPALKGLRRCRPDLAGFVFGGTASPELPSDRAALLARDYRAKGDTKVAALMDVIVQMLKAWGMTASDLRNAMLYSV